MNKPANQYSLVIDSPLGKLGIRLVDEKIHRLDYLGTAMRRRAPSCAVGRRLVEQLQTYFENPRAGFCVPFVLAGTPFQQCVWQALTDIPPGETLTYGELARRLDTGARAVGNACRRNPVSIIVPCHRVVAASGMGGYSGSTSGPQLDRKSWLLAHESQCILPLKKPALAPDSQIHP